MGWFWLFFLACGEPETSSTPGVSQGINAAIADHSETSDPCHREEFDGVPSGPQVVVLVSFDTARADGFSVYGSDEADTPVVDALAGCGVRFQNALSHVPTTLNSHTTMLSGEDPHGHGVVRNGYELSPDIPLLQERLGAAGWNTMAVVGSMALDGAMGLSRGFDVYDQQFGTGLGLPFEDRADGVTMRALAAVDSRPDPNQPLFLFVHYYDPHLPWDSAPPTVRSRFADPDYSGPVHGTRDTLARLQHAFMADTLSEADLQQARQLYRAEIHWSDHQLGVLLDGLDARGLGANRLVIVTSDHGETIGDFSTEEFMLSDGRPYFRIPIGHGDDVSTVNLHVPLIIQGRGDLGIESGIVVEDVVGLMDIAPTILSVLSSSTSMGSGQSLAGFWQGEPPPPRPHFAEATKPKREEPTDVWNNLFFDRRVTWSGVVYRDTPWIPRGPLITDLAGRELQVDDRLRRELAVFLQEWDRQAPPWRAEEMTPETEAALEALGYIE